MRIWRVAGFAFILAFVGLLTGCGSRYQVEYKPVGSNALEVKVKGPAAKLAVILINPKEETDTEIIEEEKMIDNVETVVVRMGEALEPLKPGTYRLLIKRFNPEKVVYRENLKFKLGKSSIEDVQIKYRYNKLKPDYILLTVRNEGSLPVLFDKIFVTIGGQKNWLPNVYLAALPGEHVIPSVLRWPGGTDREFRPGTYLAIVKLHLKEENEFIIFEKRVNVPFQPVTLDDLKNI